jgi:hypothetical protein
VDQEFGGSNPPSCTSKIKDLRPKYQFKKCLKGCRDNVQDNNSQISRRRMPRIATPLKRKEPDLTLPLAHPITLTGGPRSYPVTFTDAAILIREWGD